MQTSSLLLERDDDDEREGEEEGTGKREQQGTVVSANVVLHDWWGAKLWVESIREAAEIMRRE